MATSDGLQFAILDYDRVDEDIQQIYKFDGMEHYFEDNVIRNINEYEINKLLVLIFKNIYYV